MPGIEGAECEDFDDGQAGVKSASNAFFTTEALRRGENESRILSVPLKCCPGRLTGCDWPVK